MLLLVSTSDKIQVVTGSAVDVHVHASYVDYNGTTVTPGRKNTVITTATTTDVVAAPGASVNRNVKLISVRNVHATNSNAVTIQHTDGTTVVELFELTLGPGERAAYNEGAGWQLWDNQGRVKTVIADPNVILKSLLSDQSNSTVTPTEVTGLTLAVGIGVYVFNYYIRYQAAALTTGVRFDVNHDGTVTHFIWNQYWNVGINTTSSDAPDQDMIAALAGVQSAFSSRAKGTAGRGTTLSVDTANADMLMVIEGMMQVTVAGNLELWHGSEVAAASTVKAGTALILTKVG